MTIASTPMLAWALAAVAGGWIGWSHRPTPGLLAASTALALVAARRARSPGPRVAASAAAVLALVVLLTGLHLDRLDSGPLVELADGGGSQQMTGVVVAEPRPVDDGWWTILRIERVGERSDRQRALWRGSGEAPALGSTLRLAASARPLEPSGFGDWLRTRHVAVQVDAASADVVAGPGWVHVTTNWVRHRVRELAGRALGDGAAGLAVGLVTGDVSLLPTADVENMNATGLSHLTAVSGSNVAIVLAGALMLARASGLRGSVRRALLLGVMAWFAVLTRLEPSVLRASLMAAVVLLAQSRGQRTEPIHALSAATLLLILVDPFLARSLGLLLSVTATAGLLLVAPLVARRLGGLPAVVRVLVATSIGAQLAVSPVLLLATDDVPLVSIVANVVAVPAAAVASSLALLGATIGLVVPVLGRACFWLAATPLEVVLASARALVGRGPEVSLGVPAMLLAAAGTWLVSPPGSLVARRSGRVAMALLLVVATPVGLLPGSPVRVLTVTAIDVGQGDAILAEIPGVAVLVDGGDGDAAAAWLDRHGPERLDLVVVSHPHADHVDGLPGIVAASRVGAIWWRPLPEMTPGAEELALVANARGIPMHEPQAGERVVLGEMVIEVLGPPPGRPYQGAGSEPNEMSIVLRLAWRGRSVLLTGDVETAAQADLLERPALLAADVLKVPHHGGATSRPEFLAAVGASVAVISVGTANDYGHPHPDALAALDAAGAIVRRTDLEGTIRVELAPRDAAAPVAVPSVQPVRRRATTVFIESRRVRPARRRRRSTPGGSRARRHPLAMAGRRRRVAGHGPRGQRAGTPAGASDAVALR